MGGPPPPRLVRDDAGMLRDLDLSLAAFLRRLLPAGTEIHIGPPSGAPAGIPLLCAFLYDVREAQAPAADGLLARDDDGRATGWQRPAHRYRVSYLLTAWPQGGPAAASMAETASAPASETAGEHELLGEVLTGCATAAEIPPDCLHGELAAVGERVPLVCAGAARATDPAQLWSSLGIPARAALDLLVVAPVVPPLITELAPAVQDLEIGLRPAGAPPRPPATPAGWRKRHITEH